MIKLFYFLVFLCSAGDASLLRAVPTTAQPSKVATEERVWYLLPNGTMQHDKAFLKLYQHFNDTFDFKLYGHFLDQLKQGVVARNQRDAYSSFTYYAKGPHCDKGQRPQQVPVIAPSAVAAFPGGSVKRLFGFDFGKAIFDVTKKAEGAAGAAVGPPLASSMQGLGVGMGMVQSIVASMIDTIPPLIPPPAWNNMPLTCAPMITGHNCFGAVLYPITMADFIIADVTDAMLDGYIAGFPNTYAEKVGKTSDTLYKACFSAYMSMHCSSIFPRCTVPQSRSEPIPSGGRVPMCLHLCILPLVLCPGFWIGDVIGQCEMVAPPPMCTQAHFWNYGLLPPQYVSFSDANPYPKRCPPTSSIDGSEDPRLFDDEVLPESPVVKEASMKLPGVNA
jgi:hypothetical protein